MLKPISGERTKELEKILDNMSLEDKIGQVLCPWIEKIPVPDLIAMIEKYHLGNVYNGAETAERFLEVKKAFDDFGKTHPIPIMQCSDLELGAGARIQQNATSLPWPMAWGALDSEEVCYECGVATAKEGRMHGHHWNLAPVVDLSMNHMNPMCYARPFGENPKRVAALTRAFIRGMQEHGMAATAKHFPGDGVDAREPHVATSVHSLALDEWYETYGYVYQQVIEEGVLTIMTAHMAFPAVDPGTNGALGMWPATLSKKITTDFLKGELGFDGVVVTDAIRMIGYSAHYPINERVARSVAAGADIVLGGRDEDYPWLMECVDRGIVDEDRLTDACRRILNVKERIGLFDGSMEQTVTSEDSVQFNKLPVRIAENCMHIVRNDGKIPVKLEKGDKVLCVDIQFLGTLREFVQSLPVVREELEKRGFEVDYKTTPFHGDKIREIMHDYKAVFVNFNVPPRYGSTRMVSELVESFWRAWWTEHPQAVFTSFCNPYTLWELPQLPNYINVFSNHPANQAAAVKLWLGELDAKGKTPVGLEGMFE
ncbi:MAG: hypothetical protein GF350_13910, partial [Chitinivibrionales bacterium]|nr:hypothetical protein [Chitinivibrionales bacterium]